MSKYLFIGGSADGHLINVPSDRSYWNIDVQQRTNYQQAASKPATGMITIEEYRKVSLINGSSVFVHQLNDDEIQGRIYKYQHVMDARKRGKKEA